MTPPEVDAAAVQLLAELQQLTVPEEDLEPLAAALTAHLQTVAAINERYRLDDVEPALTYDPRWA
jgi:hypothetical protein